MGALSESADRIQEQVGGQVAEEVVGYFVRERAYHDELSAAAGEPVYVLLDFCMQRVPGRVGDPIRQLVRKTYPDGREVVTSEFHLKKYPKSWDAFLRGEDLKPDGQLLEDCSEIPRGRIASLKAAQVRTVEELAHLPDASLRRIGHDGMVLRGIAQGVIEARNSAASMENRIAELEARLAAAEKQGVDDDSANAENPVPRRRGRPRNKPTE